MSGSFYLKFRNDRGVPEIVWADDEAGCYGVLGRDAQGTQIVMERSGPIRIVSARR